MSTRRTILRGIIGSLAASAYALAGGPTTSTAAAAQQGDRQWFEESLSGTRDATQEERDSILPDLHNRVIEAGHPSETVDVAATGVTASVSSRGTTVLKAALMMSEELFFILVKEASESSAPGPHYWHSTPTARTSFVASMSGKPPPEGSMTHWPQATEVNCCSAFGMPPATILYLRLSGTVRMLHPLCFRWRSPRSRMRHTLVQLLCSRTLYRVLRPV